MDEKEIHVPVSAGDVIKTSDGCYYKVSHGVVRVGNWRHALEIMGRYPVPLFPFGGRIEVDDPGAWQPNISWSGDEDELNEIADDGDADAE